MDSRVVKRPGHDGGSGGTVTVPPAFLIVLCHGVESDSRQMAPLAMAWRRDFPGASFMVPDAPETCRGRFWRAPGRQWFSLAQPREMQMTAAAEAAAGLNARIDAELKRRCLVPGAVVYCGFSQGAMVALLAGVLRTEPPLGIVSMAGSLLLPQGELVPQRELVPQGELVPEGDAVGRCRPPVLLVHGAADRVVPAARSEEAARRLRAAGMRVQLEILPLLDHMIVTEAAPYAADFIAGLGV